jgi:hypothetical protein
MVQIKNLIEEAITGLSFSEKVDYINSLREFIHQHSPFKNEPVDFVKWVINDNVIANDYNPNKVAPPEMELLEVSIMNDGYTQPIVTWPKEEKIEVIDGFHRSRVGKESKIVKQRVNGYLPTVIIRKDQEDKNDRIASTIRHNRARGKHQIDAMSEIVLELKNRNWKNSRIAKELGMDEDEILRLCQISGLQELFKDDDFSKSWESSDSIHSEDYEPISDDISEEDALNIRTVNTSDPDRIFHTFDKWECAKAGFYANSVDGMKKEECESKYLEILGNEELFSSALEKIIIEWKCSCEHYLTNKAMNRIAWLGQAAVCYSTGVPSKYCSGWSLLTPQQQRQANEVALKYLNVWLLANGMSEIEINDALSLGRQVNIY